MQDILSLRSKYNELRVEKIRINFFLLINKGLSILYLISILIPVFNLYMPDNSMVAIVLLWLITAGLFSLKWLKKIHVFFLILSLTCLAFFIVIYNALGQVSMLNQELLKFYYYFLSFFPVLMFWFYYDNSPSYLRPLTNLALVMIGITIYTTLVGLDKYPMASRLLATANISMDQRELLTSLNIGGYAFGYSLVFLIPVLVFVSKNSLPLKKVFSILLIFMIVYLNYNTMFITAVVFCTILLVISISTFQEKKIYFILLLFFAPVLLLFFKDIFIFLLELNFVKENTFIYNRVMNVYEYAFYDYDLSHVSRVFEYSLSISALEKNILLGYAASGQMGGGHMQWIDFINYYGIVGGGLLFGVFYTIYKGFRKIFRFDSLLCIVIVFVALLIMGSIKNTILSPTSGLIIFFLMPSILFLSNCRNIKNSKLSADD